MVATAAKAAVTSTPAAAGAVTTALGKRRGAGPAAGATVARAASSACAGRCAFSPTSSSSTRSRSSELARVLNELKTERAQAEVDGRRTTAAFADAVGGAAFDEAKAGEGASLRVQSAEKLKGAVHKALREIHAVLSDEQRQRLAYLIRTGVVTL